MRRLGEDHIHLLARFGRTTTQAEWMKELKRVSNHWLKEHSHDYSDFEWQGGYAGFSVSQSNLEQVKQYIAGQEEHHRNIGFQDELRALLRKHEIEWMRNMFGIESSPCGKCHNLVAVDGFLNEDLCGRKRQCSQHKTARCTAACPDC